MFKWLLGRQVKAALDALPFNGKKTLLSVITTILTIIILVGLGSDFYLKDIIDVLANFGGVTLLSSAEITALIGAVSTLVGIVHKVLKAIDALEGQ